MLHVAWHILLELRTLGRISRVYWSLLFVNGASLRIWLSANIDDIDIHVDILDLVYHYLLVLAPLL